MQTYDGVVIGAGHNGLTLAAYMARAGMKIAVLERNTRIVFLGQRPRVRWHAGLRRASRRRCVARGDGEHGREA